jgi:hypothetical protein
MVQRVLAADDIYDAQGQVIEADDTVYFWFGGQWYEIDLTRGHQLQMARDLKPYTDVARKVKTGPKEAEPQRHAGKPRKRGKSRSHRKDWTGFKAWCDLNGRTYVSPGGGFYPKVQDERDYDQWLAGSPAPRAGEPGDQVAGQSSAA